MNDEVEYIRLVGNERRVGNTLESVSKHWKGDKEKFLFVSPHDDDVVLGSGLFVQLAMKEGVEVYIIIVTDGSMGYCTKDQRNDISDIRQKEANRCYKSLGIPKENIIWLAFPDCRLNYYRGRRLSDSNDMTNIEGFVGLQNSFTYWIRKIAPTQCFLPTSNDLHPDHKIVHEEFLISLFHAGGDIWPEMGKPVQEVPHVHEFAVYCDFPEPPKVRIKTPRQYLDNKLDSIGMFKSQKQISSLIDIVRKSGPYEYLRELDFKFYQPAAYFDRFEKKHYMPFVT